MTLIPALGAHADDAQQDGVFRRWTAINMVGGTMTAEQARSAAVNSTTVVANAHQIRDHVPAMREANPDLQILHYVNASFGGKTPGAYPNDWYARDAAGRLLTSTGWNNHLMDLNNPAWRSSVVHTCQQRLQQSGFDGCYLDMLGTAPLVGGYLTGTPVNSVTGQAWTPQEWIAATGAIAAAVRDAIAPAVLAGNGLGNGQRYFSHASPLTAALSLGTAEAYLRHAHRALDGYKTEADWVREVDMLVDAEARGVGVQTVTKIFPDATQQQVDDWREYALASFLMGANGRSEFSFQSDRDGMSVIDGHAWEQADLGAPAGAHARYTKVGGVYQRTFQRGRVLVNPTSTPATVTLDAEHIDVRSGQAVTSVTLGANEAAILTTSGASGQTGDSSFSFSSGTATVQAQFTPRGDRVARYSVDVSAGEQLTWELRHHHRAEFDLYLLDADGTVVAQDTGTANPTVLTHAAATGGTWTVEVVAEFGSGAYDLSLSRTS